MNIQEELEFLMKDAVEKRASAIDAIFLADEAERKLIEKQKEFYNWYYLKHSELDKGEENGSTRTN